MKKNANSLLIEWHLLKLIKLQVRLYKMFYSGKLNFIQLSQVMKCVWYVLFMLKKCVWVYVC